jgi:hypothetical protein
MLVLVMMLVRQTAGALMCRAASVFLVNRAYSLVIFLRRTAERAVTAKMKYTVCKRNAGFKIVADHDYGKSLVMLEGCDDGIHM